MVVSPRYAEYEDACDTGTSVPVLLPPSASLQAPAAAECKAADSSPALSRSQSDARASRHADTAADSRAQDGSLHQAGTTPDSSQTQAGAALQQRQDAAQYYLCRRGSVDHVFVDHPMYCRTSDIYGSSNVNTYQEAGDFPDLDLRYSILCQAALAAPLLLWHGSQGAQSAKKLNEDSGAAAQQQDARPRHTLGQGADQTLPGVSHLQLQPPSALHLLPAGSVSAVPTAAEATSAPMHAETPSVGSVGADSVAAAAALPLQAARAGPSSIAPAALPPAGLGSAQGGPAAISLQAEVANGSAAAAEHGLRSGCPPQEPGQAAAHHSSSMRDAPGQHSQAARSAAPLVFVSNDWPCAPLALRLEHSVRSAQASAASQVHSAPQSVPRGLEHEGSGASISSGEPQLSGMHSVLDMTPPSDYVMQVKSSALGVAQDAWHQELCMAKKRSMA